MITARSYIVAPDIGSLAAAVTAALSASVQPAGAPVQLGGYYVQPMDTDANSEITYAVDGAISVDSGLKRLTKATAGAYTLAAPSADGQRIVIFSDSAAAHVVTATNLIHDGVTGGAKDTMTFAAFHGASIELIGRGGLWYVVSKNVVTIAGA